ncbi:Hypothetical protein R9X50_00686000 [Acrodontium crateriforme]|uniref:Uncharacterized protein n=1 Tax=Acrodontium crateriforme TaxID=150365 RepID=A0AAQ3MDK4_9PEZI|nr:Hypothetical protein R9X50_00686000 [Acrodontium crateriforme]
MTRSDLPARQLKADDQHHPPSADNPFSTPPWHAIQHPQPVVHADRSPRHSRNLVTGEIAGHQHDRQLSHAPNSLYKSSSLSSAASSAMTGVIPSIDLEKAGGGHTRSNASARRVESRNSHTHVSNSRRASRDPEKAILDIPTNSSLTDREPIDDDRVKPTHLQEAKALSILLFLCSPCLALSFLNTIWTFIALFITLLTQPIRLCARRPSFSLQLSGLLGPPLNLQLRSIYTALPPHANEDCDYNAFTLVLVHFLSPLLSLGMMLVAWVVAVYWASSAIVGDPAGMDKQDDGRETVLALRRWWERWLLQSVKENDGL